MNSSISFFFKNHFSVLSVHDDFEQTQKNEERKRPKKVREIAYCARDTSIIVALVVIMRHYQAERAICFIEHSINCG
jgi:hypothetical protein